MYCKNCGKELPNGAAFCPECGTKQNNVTANIKTRIRKFVNEHKKVSYAYLVWFLVHTALCISSTKEDTDGFYPWDKPLNEMLTYFGGGRPSSGWYDDWIYGHSYRWEYEFSWLDEHNVYDFSELFFYTILLPVIIYGFVKCWPHISPFLVKKWETMKKKISQKRNLKAEKEQN